MNLQTNLDCSIIPNNNPEGSLEIIDDVGLTEKEQQSVLQSFSIPAHFIDMKSFSLDLWRLIKSHTTQERVTYILPGNGAWFVKRALEHHGIDPKPSVSCNISRESNSPIQIKGNPDHIVVIDDVVETGGTALRFIENLRVFNRPVTLATVLWHDRAHETKQVLDAFSAFANVLVGIRIRSFNPLDDIRSLSTIARKATITKNQRYSKGCESKFLTEMKNVLDNHPFLYEVGSTLGPRPDPIEQNR